MDQLSYRRHRFPPPIIQHAIWLYLRFTLSYRDVEELLAERGLEVSYETVRRWVLKFGPGFARRLRRSTLDLLRKSGEFPVSDEELDDTATTVYEGICGRSGPPGANQRAKAAGERSGRSPVILGLAYRRWSAGSGGAGIGVLSTH